MLYLGNLTEETVLKEDTYLVKVLLAASKVRITRKWYGKEYPTQRQWLDIVEKMFVMEKLTQNKKPNLNKNGETDNV